MRKGGVDRIDLAQDRGHVAGSFEDSDKTLGYVNCGKIFDCLRNFRLFKKDCTS